jgi:hypothetical protein
MSEDLKYEFFIAHAGIDKAQAEELYQLLDPKVRTFLDSRCILPGDDWDTEIAKAQRRSLVTVVLISKNTPTAHYQREEIAAAIAYARENPETHSVVPVFLDSASRLSGTVPYGLRIKHGFTVTSEFTLTTVAKELFRLADSLRATGSVQALDGAVSDAKAGPFFHALVQGLPMVFNNLTAEALRNTIILPYLRAMIEKCKRDTYGFVDVGFAARMDYYLVASFPELFEAGRAFSEYMSSRSLRIYKTDKQRGWVKYWAQILPLIPHPFRRLLLWADDCTREQTEQVIKAIGFTVSNVQESVPALIPPRKEGGS